MIVEANGIKYEIFEQQILRGIGRAEREYKRLTEVYGDACASMLITGEIVVFGCKKVK